MSQNKNARKRGIRASRAKLMQALHAEGLKTQTALAERMAALEGLETAPKDLINRVFRELSVDPSTIERVAAVLKVPAHTLYLSSDEPDFHSESTKPDAPSLAQESNPQPSVTNDNQNSPKSDNAPKVSKQTMAKKGPILLTGLGVVALLVALVMWLTPGNHSQAPQAQANILAALPKSLVIYPSQPALKDAAEALESLLPNEINSKTIAKHLVTAPHSAPHIADQFQADGVITLNQQSLGRYQFTQIHLYHGGHERQIATIHHTEDELKYHPEQFAKLFMQPLQKLMDGAPLPATLSLAEQKDFLQARSALEQEETEVYIKRAQTLLLNLLDQQPQFYLAHTGLCQAYLNESWMGNEKALLERATEYCDKAAENLPNNPYTMQTQGELLRRTGRINKAKETLQKSLLTWPNIADTHKILSRVELNLYQKSEGGLQPELLENAIKHGELAVHLTPNNYNNLATLGMAYYSGHQYPEMIDTLNTALKIKENATARFNLSVAYLCNGQPDKTLEIIQQADASEHSLARGRMLGMGYYFAGDFNQSVKHRKSATEAVGIGEAALQHLWGDLADAQRHQGDNTAAIESYRTAMAIITRNDLRGNSDTSDKVFFAYYYQMLNTLDPINYPSDSAPYTMQELEDLFENSTENSTYFRLALVFNSLGQTTLKREATAAAIASCPGYDLNPDFAQLQDQ